METLITSQPVLSAKNLYKAYGRGDARVPAVDGIDIELMPGEIVAIMGASGSGKSTLLNLLAGLTRPDKGQVWLDGSDLAVLSDRRIAALRGKNMGVVFQAYNLLPTVSALDNVALPLMLAGIRGARNTAKSFLSSVGLDSQMTRRPPELSGGEQQRVALARALVNNPQVILADEPTGNLDRANVQLVCDLFKRVVATNDRAIAIVTHEPFVACYADRVIVLSDGQIADQFVKAEAPSPEEVSRRCLQASSSFSANLRTA
ncbi:MAG: ABC transporter ATP-binding protein [Pirellulales bacterium]